MRLLRTSASFDPLSQEVARRVCQGAAGRIRHGCLLVTLPDGSRRVFGDATSAPMAEMIIHDLTALQRILLGGEIGLGEAYVDGLWSSPDLVSLIKLGASNSKALSLSAGWWRVPARLRRTVAHRLKRNTRRQARRNIEAHYDLGNEFYKLFLDETMTYSSAVFESPDQSLADAQRNKYRIISARAGLIGGEHVLEIGSGWGGFALYAAGELGCRVSTITISEAQRDLTLERVRSAGLDDRVDVRLQDYRDIDGTYDAIVSIEMLEAVGAEYFETFFGVCDEALVTGGRMSIQCITMPNTAYVEQRQGANWIQTYIFPGSLLPSLAAIERALDRTGLLITRVDDISDHYSRTLSLWRTRLLERADTVRAMGFDDRFVRMWEYYLTLSEAGFDTGMTQDLQLVFEKRRGVA